MNEFPGFVFPLFIPLVLGIFVLFWGGILYILGFKWRKLAAVYGAQNMQQIPVEAEKRYVSYFSMGWTQYKGSIKLWATSQGIFLKPIWIFKMGHPLIFIPWQDIESQGEAHEGVKSNFGIKEHIGFLWAADDFVFRNAPDMKINVDTGTGAFLREKKKQYKF